MTNTETYPSVSSVKSYISKQQQTVIVKTQYFFTYLGVVNETAVRSCWFLKTKAPLTHECISEGKGSVSGSDCISLSKQSGHSQTSVLTVGSLHKVFSKSKPATKTIYFIDMGKT